ncbi:PepSY-like domain-containing protein [Solitalea canadensis]|uniref:Beta-lactamase-inhibitor-like PepSY-like domain-containing protein n=1 Tax=Solitalea canadensis (strain ATCC 29591 / DSM 3403 / JCM 21819 / LMG 8368 / NBRC 15130 / NCIMB 12057 / USAM 9D) TaxID=929556 RepID=H8KVH9_SOLCM|nr:PepSY-like domain-containing protein [Solitalea canadensis]AFD06359.1 Protein of unknown function (DUF2874) [Solitalea canadensis DSM 3403]
MKTTLRLLTLISIVFSGSAFAQSEQSSKVLFDAKKVDQKELPAAVVASVKKDFPNASLKEVYSIPASVYESDWQVITKNPVPKSMDIQYYSLKMSGKEISMDATYDSKGKLLTAKEYITNGKLPRAIPTYIANTYPGYAVKSDEIQKWYKNNQKKAIYEVAITKGTDKKKLYFDENNKLIKVK